MLATVKNKMTALGPVTLTETDYPTTGYNLDVGVLPAQVTEAVAVLDQEGFFLETITGVDWLGEKKAAPKAAPKAEGDEAPAADEPPAEAQPEPVEEMEVVYDFNHAASLCRVVIRTRIPRDTPELPTISAIYPGANWHERETHDFFGIRFTGHPNLEPLLLPEDADFHPLLKDFRP